MSPANALALGLKVDADVLPPDVVTSIRSGTLSLQAPATTLALLKLNAVVGVTGIFAANGSLQSVGIQCALCHSTVDNSVPGFCGSLVSNPGTGCIGHRLDGWPNRDLNIGQVIALAPDLTPFTTVLGADPGTVRSVLQSWGPGKFDAELILDGKTTNPTGGSAATLIPPAFGLAGVNLHTWTGWGSVTHWNAFVANLEMHGIGRFFDPRLNGRTPDFQMQFPLAARNNLANVNPSLSPEDDQITSKLPALHFYQLALASPAPPTGSFDSAAAGRGDKLFSGKAQCNNCHVEPLWTEPGWNMHKPNDICIDSFQSSRAPDMAYRTSPLGGLFAHQKGGFYQPNKSNP